MYDLLKKSMPFLSLFCVVIIISSSCGRNRSGEAPENINISNPTFFYNIDTLIDSLEFISLETSEGSIIGKISSIRMDASHIYVYDEISAAIYIFDSGGRYYSKINTAEFHFFYFAIHDQIIYILDDKTNTLVRYKADGTKISSDYIPIERNLTINSFSVSAGTISIYGSKIQKDYNKFYLYVLDNETFNILNQQIRNEKLSNKPQTIVQNFYSSDSCLLFFEPISNSVSSMNINNMSYLTKYRLVDSSLIEKDVKYGGASGAIRIFNVWDKNGILLTGYYNNEFSSYLVWDKKKKEIIANAENLYIGDINLGFSQTIFAEVGDTKNIFTFYEPEIIIEWVKNNEAAIKSHFPVKEIMQLKNLRKEDNPVILKMTLK